MFCLFRFVGLSSIFDIASLVTHGCPPSSQRCGRIQKKDWNMSHRLFQRIEPIVQQISQQVNICDKGKLLKTKTLKNINESTINNVNHSNKVTKYQPLSCNPNLRLYKYTKGQWFGRHVDDSNKIDFHGSTPFPAADNVKEAQTEMTVLFYLSSCRGGATRFHLLHGKNDSGGGRGKKDRSVAFAPEEGAVLLHVHGDNCLEHEAEPVLEGIKYGEKDFLCYFVCHC